MNVVCMMFLWRNEDFFVIVEPSEDVNPCMCSRKHVYAFVCSVYSLHCTCADKFTSYVRFEVFTTMTMKNISFWDVVPCGSGLDRWLG
jgi:hypothetical protein